MDERLILRFIQRLSVQQPSTAQDGRKIRTIFGKSKKKGGKNFLLFVLHRTFRHVYKSLYSTVTAVPAAVTMSMEPLPPTVS